MLLTNLSISAKIPCCLLIANIHRLYEVYPALQDTEKDGKTVEGITNQNQALYQLAASAVTILIALVGGVATGKHHTVGFKVFPGSIS